MLPKKHLQQLLLKKSLHSSSHPSLAQTEIQEAVNEISTFFTEVELCKGTSHVLLTLQLTLNARAPIQTVFINERDLPQ